MSNKRTVMTFSGLQILIFHLWVNMSAGSTAEMFIKQTAYIGVDIFFFLSGYSLSSRKVSSYWDFLKNRFGTVYIKFFIFAVIAALIGGWKAARFLKVITGVNLFTAGGGAFLWFLPAILIFYILFPPYQKTYEKHPLASIIASFVIWLAAGLIMSGFRELYHIFIVWNRIPVFILGCFMAQSDTFSKLLCNSKKRVILGVMLTAIGGFLLYLFAFRTRLQMPIRDMFYVMGIPACIGLILLIGMIPENIVIRQIGMSTLEMYAVQMILGYSFANRIIKLTGNKGLTNLCTIVFVILLAVFFRVIYEKLRKLISSVELLNRTGNTN